MTELTPQEINLRIAKALFGGDNINQIKGRSSVIIHYGRPNCYEVDYCNNISDLWPLVVEHDISLAKHWDGNWYGEFRATPDAEWVSVKHKNPQLALALCLLEVLEAKTDE